MNENMPVSISKQEISYQNQHPYMVTKGKKRRRKRKRLWTRLFCITLIGISIYFLSTKFTIVKDYFSKFMPQLNVSDTTNSSSNIINNDNSNNDEGFPENDKNINFIDTCPKEFEFINETNSEILLDKKHSYSKAKELYEKYSYDAPIVLIVNFSPKEAFCDYEDFYSDEKNVSSLGKEITDRLNKNGINTMHLFDTSSNSLYESKNAYEQKILETLNMYPSISYIFDISRTIHLDEDMNTKNECVLHNEIKYPSIQLLCGTRNGEISTVQNKSCSLAYELSNFINVDSVPFISRLIVSKYSLSQNFDRITLRVDIGSYACKYEDALLSAYLFTDGIISFLND